jgi:hypothetical protein
MEFKLFNYRLISRLFNRDTTTINITLITYIPFNLCIKSSSREKGPGGESVKSTRQNIFSNFLLHLFSDYECWRLYKGTSDPA